MVVSPLSGFTAVPNPQMLAFMGAQSFIMMYQAGEGWQYGKRRISAMSNEEFNKLTPELVMEKQAVVLRNSIGTIQKSMDDMTPMIGTIVKQYGDFIREFIAAIPEAVGNIFETSTAQTNGIFNVRGTQAGLADNTELLKAQVAELNKRLKESLSGTGKVQTEEQRKLDESGKAAGLLAHKLRLQAEARKASRVTTNQMMEAELKVSERKVLLMKRIRNNIKLWQRHIQTLQSQWRSSGKGGRGSSKRRLLTIQIVKHRRLIAEARRSLVTLG